MAEGHVRCADAPRRKRRFGLLADAEPTEDAPEQLFAIGPAHDFADRLEGRAQLFRDEFGRNGIRQRGVRGLGIVERLLQAGLVAGIDRDGPIAARRLTAEDAGGDSFLELRQALLLEAGDADRIDPSPARILAQIALV